MYDREVVPRMPWHDIAMHVVGQPARDLTRHFVQRWNYILRQRKPTRPTPFLLPPPDFNPADLEALGLDGSCEVQVLRSSSTWSTGTPEVTEHSIMNAYVKMIEKSEHFVYIENQFFVSSCEVEGKKIENLIGDALVERIVRAARNEEDWRAVILIPLMPGFQNTVDTEGGTSVRLIMQCQYRSICRGETSIFGRLRAQEHLGVDVDEIMEQEMGGEVESRKSRQENSDSCASEGPRDTDNWGEREDEREILERRHRLQDEFLARSEDMHSFNHDVDWEQANNPNLKSNRKLTADARVTRNASHRKDLEGFGVDQMQILHEAGQITGRDSFLGQDNVEYLKEVDVNEKQKLQKDSKQRSDSRLPTPSELNTQEEDHPSILEAANSPADVLNQQQMAFHNDDAASNQPTQANPLTQSNNCHLMLPASARPIIDKDCMKDPLCDAFYLDTWQAIAENNTKVFRMVFRCMPDSEVKSWKEYKEYTAYAERFADMQNNYFYDENAPHLQPSGGSKLQSGPPGAGVTSTVGKVGHDVEKIGSEAKQVVANHLSNEASAEDSLKQWAAEANRAQIERQQEELAKVETLGEKEALKAVETKSSQSSGNVEPSVAFPDVDKALERQRSGAQTNGYPDALALNGSLSQRRRRRGTTRSSKREFHASDDIISMHEAEELLGMVQGHLVLWPYEWCARARKSKGVIGYIHSIKSPLWKYITKNIHSKRSPKWYLIHFCSTTADSV
ncbi:phospholipase D2 [Coccidioides immitis H538.4]|uniref:Phospholipase D2 n=1 Tax=Coccidioides immitis H538.4 TaxID=396776 RepID=A0A0J8RW06_COCIT|nr:phospholipase D2 [Coccidioides immitis H538.4]